MTTSKILTLLAVILCAAQIVLTKPLTSNEDFMKHHDLCKLKNIYVALASTEKDHTMTPSLQLMKVIMFSLQDLAITYVRKAKTISDYVLKESVITGDQTPEVQNFKHAIEEFNANYSTCKDMQDLYNLIAKYSNATYPYYKMEKKETLKAESKLILDVLKKYSPQDIDDEFNKQFLNTFVVTFGQKVNELKEKLKVEEGGIGAKALQWWEDVQSLKTPEEIMKAVKKLTILYGFEEDEEV